MKVDNFEPLYRELLSERRFFHAVLDHVGEAIVACDADGTTTFVNRAARELFGLPEDCPPRDVIIPYSALFHGDGYTPLEPDEFPLRRVLREGGVRRLEIVVVGDGRESRKLAAEGRALVDDDGPIIGAVAALRDVTLLERLTAESRDYEARFWGAFDSANIGIALVRPDGRWLEVNSALATILGYERQELLAMSFQDVTHPDDLAEDIRHLHRLLAKEVDNLGFETRYLRQDGHVVWADVSMSSVEDARGDVRYFVTQILDITERKRMLEALEASERNFRSIFDSQASAVLYTDAAGRIMESNPAVNRLLGYEPRELIGRNMWILYDADSRVDLLAEARARGAQSRPAPWERECELMRKDGGALPCAVTGSVMRAPDGSVIGYVWHVRDLSAQRRAEEELAETYERLATSREEERLHLARELHDSSVQDLIAIGYQLASLKRDLGRSSEDDLAAALGELRSDVIGVVKQLRSVISELRPADLEEFGFVEALEGYIARLERSRGKRLPALQLEIDDTVDDLPAPVTICLFRAAQEALANTVKHADAERAHVRLMRFDREVVLVVEDDGRGFDIPDDLHDLTQDDHFGLAGIAERVELMRGILTIRSQKERGTELSVTLKLSEEEDG